jgi:hypothetical protein
MEKSNQPVIVPAVRDQKYNPNKPPISDNQGLPVTAFVCQDCGYVELYYLG